MDNRYIEVQVIDSEKTICETGVNHFEMVMHVDSKCLRGVMKQHEPMARHTSWRVGGPADKYYQAADLDDLAVFLAMQSEDEPITWLGLGSNLLVRDKGIRGTVVAHAGVLDELSLGQAHRLRVGAGVSCAKVARFATMSGCSGAEFLIGIPGTVGGALAMNAGAFGGEMWDIVESVETINRRGEVLHRARTEFRIAYRTVSLAQGEWFVAAGLQLQIDHKQSAQKQMRDLLATRAETQPMGEASCGSVFRNPEADHAARLIEACGLKGLCIGNACVSEKHANFIINRGGASADDIERLILHVQQVVKQRCGIALQTEVRIIGERC